MAPVRSTCLLVATLGVGLILPMSAPAQDVGPALDPGAMVGYAGGEAVRYDNQRRAKLARRSNARPTVRRQEECSDVAALRQRVGSLSRDDYMRYRRCQGLPN
ncbi:hypothetical protein [Sphingomonas sanxanigenens]|uniref:Uncharacterized protein n=1 Tax=Sphingomonas sanxanigenens DSM 19645 = NX02 TaxID=1123269 RepID=W0ACL9_9SPHN|nr:hypothetical protein [Sphingomonas sanxanigenens]AHE54836.1 hypothetical protein NX02_15780 [Sphingomonas sanxanigenens DSM 19645 = NX02]